jgi:soluble lytic murein transglycosylase-like protein
MILAIMFRESTFRAHAVSPTNDYGIMQINRGNHKWLSESLGITDFLDPKQSIDAGTFHLKGIVDNGYDDVHKILMVYNLGGRKAKDLWNQGINTSAYSRSVVDYMESLRWMRRNKNALPDARGDHSDDDDEEAR